MTKKNNKTYTHEQIRLEVNIIDDTPILNVFMEDGAWFAIGSDQRVTVDSKCHPNHYEKVWGNPMHEKVWGNPMPISSIKPNEKRRPT